MRNSGDEHEPNDSGTTTQIMPIQCTSENQDQIKTQLLERLFLHRNEWLHDALNK